MNIFAGINNPGLDLNLLTDNELEFVQFLAGLTYLEGDILYHNGTQMTNLGIGNEADILLTESGVPSWGIRKTPINIQAGISYTLQSSDASRWLEFTNSDTVTVTVPNSTFLTGTKLFILKKGNGDVDIQAGSGFTLNSPVSVSTTITENNGSRAIFFSSPSVGYLV